MSSDNLIRINMADLVGNMKFLYYMTCCYCGTIMIYFKRFKSVAS